MGGSLYDHLTVTGLESGMTISDGVHSNIHRKWPIHRPDRLDAQRTSNHQRWHSIGITLAFNATSTALNGETHTTTDYLNIVSGSTIVTGTSGDDMVAATSTGASFLAGGAGQDNVVGNAGNDRLLGESGDDNLTGLGGHDVLVGGAGNDLLTGGAGNDVFRWELNDGGAKNSPSVDYISDFSSTPGNKDVLDLRDLLRETTTLAPTQAICPTSCTLSTTGRTSHSPQLQRRLQRGLYHAQGPDHCAAIGRPDFGRRTDQRPANHQGPAHRGQLNVD